MLLDGRHRRTAMRRIGRRTHPALTALLYLTFFSSCLAYTAYGWLSLNASPALIGTYGYVNPAIASFLGWQFLHEHLSARRNSSAWSSSSSA